MTGFECDTFSSTFWFTAWHVWPEAKQPLLVASGYINRQGQRTAAGGGGGLTSSLLFFHKKRSSLGQRRRRSSGKTDNNNNNNRRCQSETIQPLPLLPPSSFPIRLPVWSVALPILGTVERLPENMRNASLFGCQKTRRSRAGGRSSHIRGFAKTKAFPSWWFSNHGRDPSSLHHKRRKSQNVSPFIFRCVCDDFAPAAV